MLLAYADENIKMAIVDGLRRHGLDVTTVHERGQGSLDDELLLATAAAEGRLLLTNDADFLRIHASWLTTGRQHAGILYWRQELPIGDAIRRILQYALQVSAVEAQNTVKFV